MDFYGSFKQLEHSFIHFSVNEFHPEITAKLTKLKPQDLSEAQAAERILAT